MSLCKRDGNEKIQLPKGDPISRNTFPKVAKPQNVINIHAEDKKQSGKKD